jgi:hypothetical protein
VLEIRSSLRTEDKKTSEYYYWKPEYFKVEKMHPASGTDIPDHLPEEVARLFQQAADNVPANPDAAGTMFRKTLEAILRDKCPAATGLLKQRIEQAFEAGVLSADLSRYADTIRLEGNEAAHGSYDEDDARQLHELVSLMLNFVYTLPGRWAEIDAKARAAATGKTGET